VQILLSAPVATGMAPRDLPGLDVVARSGPATRLAELAREALASARGADAAEEAPSDDPATRMQQLIFAQLNRRSVAAAQPLAIIVAGNVEPEAALDVLEQRFAAVSPGKLPPTPYASKPTPHMVREQITKPLAQGAIGYVVEGPPAGTRDALVWRMLLYILTHDYSGRLGMSAIRDKGLLYHIYSALLTDGVRTWATIWSGVDPDKSDAVASELRAQLASLSAQPPSREDFEAARNHLLGRDVTAAQSNEELAAKLARDFIMTGGLRSHEQLRIELESISSADLQLMTKAFGSGTIIRVDVPRTGG
jgi:zinc protease